MNPQLFDWRAHLKVHPAAELFPPMSEAELRELAEDIKAHGVQTEIVIWFPSPDDDAAQQLLDGRNRLDALALLGLLCVDDEHDLCTNKFWNGIEKKWIDHDRLCPAHIFKRHHHGGDPYALALSFNVHRRHLTAEQKRDLIAKLVTAAPEKSNRQIASSVKVDHKTVAAVRSEREGRGEIPHVEKRTDSKGRKQPAKKSGLKPKPGIKSPPLPATESAADSAERRKQEYAAEKSEHKAVNAKDIALDAGLLDTCINAVRTSIEVTIEEMKRVQTPEKEFEHLFAAVGALVADLKRKTLPLAQDAATSADKDNTADPAPFDDLGIPPFLRREPAS